MVLKIGAEMGLNLYQIGMMLYKPGFDEEVLSDVEILIEKTEKICSLYSKSKCRIKLMINF
jgi:hypothetical protein